jgi:hypothetical protein
LLYPRIRTSRVKVSEAAKYINRSRVAKWCYAEEHTRYFLGCLSTYIFIVINHHQPLCV